MISKWLRAVINQHIPNKKVVHTKQDLIMRNLFDHFQIKRGILCREIVGSVTQERVSVLALPSKYKAVVLKGLRIDIVFNQ